MRKQFFTGLLVILLALGLAFIGCDNGSTGNPAEQEVQALPEFEGEFVASESDASSLAAQAQTQIEAVITDAIANGSFVQSLQNNARAAGLDPAGTYTYNGVTVTYSYTVTDSYPTPPYSVNFDYDATIDGTYSGYKIVGRYHWKYNMDYASSSLYSVKVVYDCVYTVSYNGYGMKVIQTGNMDISSSGSVSYNLHYSVYDNSNVRQFNYDYSY
ncbi:MAG: hypothetical protein LBU19_08720 [Treponema sp.]|jgi:hypothetical protein|nr:hypothetical protein [Treponema sp.]